MPNASVLDNIVFSGLNHIDALLDHGPDWNYQTPAGNVITYTFSVTSGNEPGETGQQAFSVSQQANARSAMAYISALTGIVFSETSNGAAASVHLCYIDIPDINTSGLCSWQGDASVIISTNELVSYKGTAWIYLDNRQFGAQNSNLTPGGAGYETLLHELGHMLGLKHPFEVDERNANTLPFNEDNSSYTLMSYRDAGGPYSTFSQYDIAALDWIYGRDGLAGALGVGSVSGARYVTGSFDADVLVGTSANDTLRGNAGDDRINGGAGEDTAVFGGLSSFYNFSELSDGTLRVQGSDGIDVLSSVEIFQFSNGSFRRSELPDMNRVGTAGNDTLTGTVGNNVLSGLGGTDTVVVAGARAGYTVAPAANGYTITANSGADGQDSLVSIERIRFADANVAIDIDGVGGQAYRLYQAAYDRAPDTAGVGFWMAKMDQGVSFSAVAAAFLDQPEFISLYGANSTNTTFVGKLYQHVLHRPLDQAGADFWVGQLDRGTARGEVLKGFSESAENVAQLVGTIQNGFEYAPYLG